MKLFKTLLENSSSYKKDIDLSRKSLSSLPNDLPTKVEGYFDCHNNQLISLQYCPTSVEGYFYCSHNRLKSLQYCPISVGGNFSCHRNQLTSLQYCPTSVGGNFYCRDNQLTSLQYCPASIGGYFECSHNQLTTLKYLPKEIGGDIFLSGNPNCYEELWMLCKTKLGGDLIINDNEKLEELFNKKYKNANHREMLRFQDEILDLI